MNKEHYCKISSFCTRAERCRFDVVEKMEKLGFDRSEFDDIIERLTSEGFIDETRYALAYVNDKFKFSKWGKKKIAYALRGKNIADSIIASALDSIDDEEYLNVKNELSASKAKSLKGNPNDMSNKAKIYRFLSSRGFVLTFFICSFVQGILASGYIEGVEKEYAGKTIMLCYEDNGITGKIVTVDSCYVDSSGYFKLKTNVTETRKCFIPLGYFKGSLFVEPFKIYSVNLPPFRAPSDEDLLNPFFAPKEILLSLNNAASDDLNIKITAFDDSFDVAFNRIISKDITPEAIELEYSNLEYKFGDSNLFFTNYRYCNYAILVNLYEPTQPNTAIDAFFIDSPVLYNNPAYWDAFNTLFEQYKDIDALSSNKALEEIVIMHHVLAGSIPASYLANVTTEKNREIADEIIDLLSTSSVGSLISTTKIHNIEGNNLDLKDFDSNQFFIIFAKSKLSNSISDTDFAFVNNKKWRGRCVAIVVFLDSDLESIESITKELTDKKNIILASENREFVKAFNVKNAPAYFRIDVNGKILEAPAPDPKEFTPW